jgi:hypothetical protein
LNRYNDLRFYETIESIDRSVKNHQHTSIAETQQFRGEVTAATALAATRHTELHQDLAQLARVDQRIEDFGNIQNELRTDLNQGFVDTHNRIRQVRDDVGDIRLHLERLSVAVTGETGTPTIISGSPVRIAASLGLLYPHLHHIIAAAARLVYGKPISGRDVVWLKSAFESLLADVSRSTAKSLRSRISCHGFKGHRRPTQPVRQQQENAHTDWIGQISVAGQGDSCTAGRKRKAPMPTEKSLAVDLFIGKLIVYLTEEPFGHECRGTGQTISGARLLFFPRPELHIVGLAASSLRSSYNLTNIPPMIAGFGIHPSNSPIFSYIESGDLRQIQRMLASGLVAPNDRDEDGESLLWV